MGIYARRGAGQGRRGLAGKCRRCYRDRARGRRSATSLDTQAGYTCWEWRMARSGLRRAAPHTTGFLAGAWLAAVSTASAAWAGSVDVTQGPLGVVNVEARDATTAQIIEKLGERFKFTVEKKPETAGSTVRSGQWTGPLDDVLRRVLKSENYTVAGDAAAPTGVTLIDITPGVAPHAGPVPGGPQPMQSSTEGTVSPGGGPLPGMPRSPETQQSSDPIGSSVPRPPAANRAPPPPRAGPPVLSGSMQPGALPGTKR
jgi:hypothetical protein